MNEQNKKTNAVQISINLDTTPVLFTDNINMTANPEGVVMDIMQRLGPTNQVRIVARIGMSREHAKKFVNKLGELMLKSEGQIATGKRVVN
jgi:hypothetical protein